MKYNEKFWFETTDHFKLVFHVRWIPMYEQEKKLTAKYPVYKKLRTVD